MGGIWIDVVQRKMGTCPGGVAGVLPDQVQGETQGKEEGGVVGKAPLGDTCQSQGACEADVAFCDVSIAAYSVGRVVEEDEVPVVGRDGDGGVEGQGGACEQETLTLDVVPMMESTLTLNLSSWTFVSVLALLQCMGHHCNNV